MNMWRKFLVSYARNMTIIDNVHIYLFKPENKGVGPRNRKLTKSTVSPAKFTNSESNHF